MTFDREIAGWTAGMLVWLALFRWALKRSNRQEREAENAKADAWLAAHAPNHAPRQVLHLETPEELYAARMRVINDAKLAQRRNGRR